VLELFAGAGNFTFALAAAGHRVTAVESEPAGVKALLSAARARGLSGRVHATAGDAARLPPGEFGVALIDPPRSGAARAVEALHDRGLDRLVYVACDPATMARDLGWLTRRGWAVEGVTPFDLFVHSGHVEILAVARRERG
jgi:23S rRNA (uracil1939-C5)-methyltransferase